MSQTVQQQNTDDGTVTDFGHGAIVVSVVYRVRYFGGHSSWPCLRRSSFSTAR
ncbi:hypothetical protein HQO26_17175 [Rhodococcus fascians]|nr:hypothetical protein [Rhodococcus fascians]MBY4418846.1 hypothetical protein [Rhodococcus fascians]